MRDAEDAGGVRSRGRPAMASEGDQWLEVGDDPDRWGPPRQREERWGEMVDRWGPTVCEYKHARGRGVISYGAADSDPRWSDVLAFHASKSGNFVSNFSLCW